MTWLQRLKRVFNIDIEVYGHCGGSVKVIACIEDQPQQGALGIIRPLLWMAGCWLCRFVGCASCGHGVATRHDAEGLAISPVL